MQTPTADTVHDQMIMVKALDIAGYFARPGRRAGEFIPGFPAENGLVVTITHSRQCVCPQQDIPDDPLEIGDELRIGPEVVGGFAPERGVFAAATLPFPIVHQRNDEADTFFVGHLSARSNVRKAFSLY